MLEKEGWDGLPRSAVSCQEIVKMRGGEGLLGAAAVTSQKIMDMGVAAIISCQNMAEIGEGAGPFCKI